MADETRGLVTVGGAGNSHHEGVTHATLALKTAALLDLRFEGEAVAPGEPTLARGAAPYVVPRRTLIGDERECYGVRGEGDFWGGWVPHDHMATKAIVHPAVSPDARAPEGWIAALPEAAADLCLRGFMTMTRADALEAGMRLLRDGPVRLKPVHADGARGQRVVRAEAELHAALDEESAILGDVLIVEEDLYEVETYSVGQVLVGPLRATYWGRQYLTTDNGGALVYGGSDLHVVRGDFEALAAQNLPNPTREVIRYAESFDALANAYIPDLLASRRNYDVASGRDRRGRQRVAILEQSWRIGGASGAELAALEAFVENPDLLTAFAQTRERYGGGHIVPEGATVYFDGDDLSVGPLTKYAVVRGRDYA